MRQIPSEKGIYPLLSLRNGVLFPHLDVPVSAGREETLAAIDAVLAREDRLIAVVAQRIPTDTVSRENLHEVGTLGIITRVVREESSVNVLIHGEQRLRVTDLQKEDSRHVVTVEPLAYPAGDGAEVEALQRVLLQQTGRLEELMGSPGPISLSDFLGEIDIPVEQVYLLATLLGLDTGKQQSLPAANTTIELLHLMHGYLAHEGQKESVLVEPPALSEILGPERFFMEEARRDLSPGVAVGLAWTEAGGEVLYVESVLTRGEEKVLLTGQLGKVMQKSARAARSYVLSHAQELGIDAGRVRESGVHIHVPAGATPKDGPSAGVTMVAALASLLTDRPARSDTAMTGEITLSGLALPVGGVKEKVLAAHRSGLKRVVLPEANQQNLRELPDHVREALEFIPVKTIREVLQTVLVEGTANEE
jgi:ATP-dependent Lon protease